VNLINFPEEPILTLSEDLNKDANEKQDMATVLHYLWRESVIKK